MTYYMLYITASVGSARARAQEHDQQLRCIHIHQTCIILYTCVPLDAVNIIVGGIV